MHRLVVVRVFGDAVVRLASFVRRIDVNHRIAEMGHVMQQLVAGFYGNGVALDHRQARIDRNVQFSVHLMP
jgi:hypothetical protein